jgi:hypothetical protein
MCGQNGHWSNLLWWSSADLIDRPYERRGLMLDVRNVLGAVDAENIYLRNFERQSTLKTTFLGFGATT